jgi:alkanesulfonate monooxygenase SsuD/methylene tetrahydromethanopterin reductase-like flavin-dependent oxidoreductase (luciferase family)
VFLPEIAGRDAFAALAALAGETNGLLLATGVVPMTSRVPLVTAMGTVTVQERSAGRMVLGLGTGPPAMGALGRLRKLVLGVRELLQSGETELEERPIRLSLLPEQPVPIWIAALGPRATRLAGEVADGVLLNWCTPDRVARARDEIADGAAHAGRDPARITVAVYVRACLDDDAAAALDSLRIVGGEYASHPAYARQFAAMGLGDEAEAAAAAHRAGRPQDVPERLVREMCLFGARSGARERLQSFVEAGADLPVVYPVPGLGDAGADAERSIRGSIEALAPAD